MTRGNFKYWNIRNTLLKVVTDARLDHLCKPLVCVRELFARLKIVSLKSSASHDSTLALSATSHVIN